ncbi:MAG: response regulator [Gammaproteobacteria bacterium]|nr:response regulator [Gammaproteobacteria bacterium]
MSDGKRKVLIVDDSADDLRVLMENLKQDYAVVAATSGEKALQMIVDDPSLDAILLDVMMPELDGYETCRRIKEIEHARNIEVIFVSSHDTVGEKLAGYDAGASDYLIKPVQSVELLQKVKLAIKNKDERDDSIVEKNSAMQAAMTAITSVGEYGSVIDFMRRSFEVENIDELASLIVEAIGNFGTENSVQIRSKFGAVNHSSRNPISPLEIELLDRLQDQSRILELGKRAIFNFGDISLLIINMPDDSDKRGRLRDHFAILLEAAESRVSSLVKDQTLSLLLQQSNEALEAIKTMQSVQKKEGVEIMDGVLRDLEAAFLSYGLTEEQEEILMAVVQTGVDKSLNNFEQGLMIDEKLSKLIEGLRSISK